MPIKTAEQQGVMTLHRVREGLTKLLSGTVGVVVASDPAPAGPERALKRLHLAGDEAIARFREALRLRPGQALPP